MVTIFVRQHQVTMVISAPAPRRFFALPLPPISRGRVPISKPGRRGPKSETGGSGKPRMAQESTERGRQSTQTGLEVVRQHPTRENAANRPLGRFPGISPLPPVLVVIQQKSPRANPFGPARGLPGWREGYLMSAGISASALSKVREANCAVSAARIASRMHPAALRVGTSLAAPS